MRQASIVKFAFLWAVPIYAAAAFFVSKDTAAGPPSDLNIHQLATILAGGFLVQAIIAPFVASRGGNNNSDAARLSRFILRAAFYESGAIYGLVLSFLSHEPMYAVYFGIPAFLLILITPS